MKKSMRRWFLAMAMTMLIVLGIPAALSADAQVARKEAGLQSFPVAGSSTQIYKGAFVCLNTSGYLVAGADTDAYRFVGVAYENVLNAGSDGDKNCRVHTGGVFLKDATSITQAMVGRMMYLVDDATFDDTSTYKIPVGVLVNVPSGSTTSGWIDVGQKNALTGLQDHLYLNTDKSDKNVRINSKTFTVAASIIGCQIKPRAGVNMTDGIIGLEVMPGVNSGFTGKDIVGVKVEPYWGATAGALSGYVTAFESTLGSPVDSGTVTGVISVLRATNNCDKAPTGGVYLIDVEASGGGVAWSGFGRFPDDNAIANDGDSKAGGTVGWIKVMIGSKVGYIQVESLA
jgi:hypothetical protein